MMPRGRQALAHALLVSTAAACAALGQEPSVTLQVSARETYVGVPVTVSLVLENVEQHEEPLFPEIPGVTIESRGVPARSSQTTIVNGRMTQRSTLQYAWNLTPRQPGRFTVPAFQVSAGGRKYPTKPIEISVVKSETGDLLFVGIAGDRQSVYVGEALTLRLQVWLRPYTDRTLGIKLSEGDMWGRIDLRASTWGVFEGTLQELAQRRRRPIGREVPRADSSGQERIYYLYEIEYQVYAQRPGELQVGDVNIVVQYPTRLERDDSFFGFGDLRLAGVRPLAAPVAPSNIEIKPIPAEGRPAFYRGAVGEYTMSATATPAEVAVGDPITLTLTIKGTGDLAALQPPPLAEIPELTDKFRVPADPLSGEVSGQTKQFSQSIRATSPDVGEIPAIPFAFFDPARGQFVVVHTKPIPISVRPAERLSAGQIFDATGATAGAPQALTELSGGILANYAGTEELLAQQTFAPGWGTAAVVLAPPGAYLAAAVLLRQRRWLQENPDLARRQRARQAAVRALAPALRQRNGEVAQAVARAVCDYVADRCTLPRGSLTRAEVAEVLARRGVSPARVQAVDQVLARCEASRYGGAGSIDADLVHAAQAEIEQLERESLT